MELNAYAKINWDLYVLGKRPDGYHELDSVFVTVSLYDTLRFELADEIALTCSDPALSADENNLVVKAARALAAASGYRGGAKMHLDKRIPLGGGMGGGSSDAACALRGLNALWGLHWELARLQPLAAALGSDVAYFLYGGWCRCRGRGEIVETLPGAREWPPVKLLLVLPPYHVATPAVYKALNASNYQEIAYRCLTDVSRNIKCEFEHCPHGLKLANGLSGAACQVEPRLAALQSVLEAYSPGRWLMSGSGAVHFVVAARSDEGSELRELFRAKLSPEIRVLTVMTVHL